MLYDRCFCILERSLVVERRSLKVQRALNSQQGKAQIPGKLQLPLFEKRDTNPSTKTTTNKDNSQYNDEDPKIDESRIPKQTIFSKLVTIP